jgi:sterol desaturase/sphingolipid hydroxylase (fatty acid hydroxylase superfamily)
MNEFFGAHQHAFAYVIQAIRTCLLLVFIVAVFTPLEHLFAVRREKFFYKGWAVNFGWYFVNGLTIALLLAPPSALIAWGVHALLPEAVTGAAAGLPMWAKMVAAMVVGEVGFYWGHRWSHEWRWLWRFHAIHHSATHISFLVNARGHPVDVVFTRLCGLVLLYATGLTSTTGANPTLIPSLVLFVGSMWSYVIHANVRWRFGPLEEVIASPAFHHWHHTLEDHKDHNYSSMLPFMDRVFGTFYLPRHWPEAYGTATPVADTVLGQILQPFTPEPKPAAETSTPV